MSRALIRQRRPSSWYPISKATMLWMHAQQGGISGRQLAVVVEVPLLLVRIQLVSEQEHGQDDICLLDHLVPVDDERMKVKEKLAHIGRSVRGAPLFQLEEVVVLRMDSQARVKGYLNPMGRPSPVRCLARLESGSENEGLVGVRAGLLQLCDGIGTLATRCPLRSKWIELRRVRATPSASRRLPAGRRHAEQCTPCVRSASRGSPA